MSAREFTTAEVALMTKGDRAAVTAFTQELLPRVYGLCFRVARDRELAEEATQETFVRALRALSQLKQPERLVAWTLVIASNTVRELLQKRPREVSLEREPAVEVEGDDDRSQQRRALEQAVASLDREERDLFLLHAVEGVGLEDLANDRRTSASAMKSRIHRIRTKVRVKALSVLEKGAGS